MSLEDRINKMEAVFGAQSALVRELRDAVTVTAELEARQGRVVKEHSEWLIAHEKAIQEHAKSMKEHDERMKIVDQRIANLVSGIGEFMRRNTK